jgi:Kef-type K+ transport system membrane component KefB
MEHATPAAFLLAFAVALLGAKLLGELVERIGQPAVLGELLAGVILGSSVLGWVPLSEGLLLLAEIGVVLLLFEVGLETDLSELLKVGGPAIAVAVLGMVLPFAGGYLISLAAGLPPLTRMFVGAALTATSIGITARVLTELKMLGTREGRIVLGAAVVDDVLGLVVLAVVSQIAEGGAIGAGSIVRASSRSSSACRWAAASSASSAGRKRAASSSPPPSVSLSSWPSRRRPPAPPRSSARSRAD